MLNSMPSLTRRQFSALLPAPLLAKRNTSTVRFSRYRIFMDRQAQGFPVTGCHGVLLGREFRMVFSGFIHDEEEGGNSLITSTLDGGHSWSPPGQFATELAGSLVKNPAKEFLAVGICGPTHKGTVLATGFHQARGSRASDPKLYEEDQRWRPGTGLI
ncbi:MAG: hypothetical protein NTY38_04480, partial [Acidobacteria bacterium]|nr:hypothetical protein [Acidobacteriota bacterium]